MDDPLTQRNALLGVGVCSVLAARHFYRAKQLWPFRASVIVAWPSLGVAVMHTVIQNSVHKNVAALQEIQPSEEVQQARLNNAAFLERMKHLAQQTKEQQQGR